VSRHSIWLKETGADPAKNGLQTMCEAEGTANATIYERLSSFSA
jgi:hypothetical protein